MILEFLKQVSAQQMPVSHSTVCVANAVTGSFDSSYFSST